MLYIPFPFKYCTKCKRALLPSEFFKRNDTGRLRPDCIDCVRQKNREWQKRNSQRAADQQKRWAENNREHVRDYHRNYARVNRDRIRERVNKAARLYRQRHPDKVKNSRDAFRRKHPEHGKESRAAYYREHREQEKKKAVAYRRKHSGKIKKYAAAYRRNHPEAKRHSQHRRRTLKLGLPYAFTQVDWQRCLDYFGGGCAVCGRPAGFWHTISMDHWIPLNNPACPGTVPTNIVPLCHGEGGCNNSKSDRDPVEWLTEKFGKRKAKQILKRIQDYFDSLTKED